MYGWLTASGKGQSMYFSGMLLVEFQHSTMDSSYTAQIWVDGLSTTEGSRVAGGWQGTEVELGWLVWVIGAKYEPNKLCEFQGISNKYSCLLQVVQVLPAFSPLSWTYERVEINFLVGSQEYQYLLVFLGVKTEIAVFYKE